MVAARGSAGGEAHSSSKACVEPGMSSRPLPYGDEPDLCPMEGDAEAGAGEPMVLKDDEDEEECAPVRKMPDPGAPTAEEVESHRTTHLPYRSWCEDCVQGRGTGEQHRSGPAGRVPVIACDYLIVTRRGVFQREEIAAGDQGDILMKILVVKDASSKFIGAHLVPQKGLGEDRYAAENIRRDILWLGYSRIILKSDNEPAIVAVTKEVLKTLKVEVLEQAASVAPPA